MKKRSLTTVLLLFALHVATAQVLMEVPLLLEVPGKEQMVRAWYDGEIFFVDGQELLYALGFTVQFQGTRLEALDAHRRHVFACAGLPQDNSCRIALRDLLSSFGDGLYFDRDRLELRASSVASTFDVRSLRARKNTWIEVPGPHLFDRTRALWGGLMASWQVRNDAFGLRPYVRLTGSVLQGTVGIDIGEDHSWVYRYDRPGSKWLTQVEAGRYSTGHYSSGTIGLSITNVPLARQHLQRVRTIQGQTAPHALIQAVISGEVVDQVQADAEGRYELQAPAWYGTTKLEVRMQALGGLRPTSELHYQLTPASLVPPKKAYYSAYAGEDAYVLNLQYGLHERLTLRGAWSHGQGRTEASSGFTYSPVTFLALSGQLDFPSTRWLTTLRMWRSGLHLNAYIDAQHGVFTNTNIAASAGKGPFSLLLRGGQLVLTGRYRSLILHPEIWLHHRTGLLMQANWGLNRLRGPLVQAITSQSWRFAAGWSFARMRLIAYAERDHTQQVYGAEGLLTFRQKSLTFGAGWDINNQALVASLSVQVTSPFGRLFAHGQRNAHGFTHSQQAQGSIHLWPGLALTPSAHQESAAELRIFEDLNGNGKQDANERVLPHIDIQLYQGGLTRLKTGALYSAHLEPYQRYQVRILEASVRDPLLHPATGWTFSFTADPGRRKVIQVPMVQLVRIAGQVTALDRAPLRLKVQLNSEEHADVYRDGGFALQVRPGRYTLTIVDVLDQEVLAEKSIEVSTVSIRVTIDLVKDRI